MSLQDTPYSMSVVSSDFIENTISSDFKEIAKRNPIIQDEGGGIINNAGISVNIRGFRVNSPLIDGIPLNNALFGYGIEEVDRVEVLAGTSGFLYGAGNVGGSINYVLKRPKATPFTKVSIGNNGGENYFTSVDTSQNITDKVSIRVNGLYEDGDRVKENNSRENKYIGLALDYKPTDDLLLGAFYSYRDMKEYGIAPFQFTGKRPDASNFDNKKSYAPDWTYTGSETNKVELKAEYNFTDSIKLRTALIHLDSDMVRNHNLTYINTNTNVYSVRNMNTGTQTGKYDGGYLYLDNEFSLDTTEHFLTFGSNFGRDRYYRGQYIYTPGFASAAHIVNGLDDFQNVKLSDLSNPGYIQKGTDYKMRDNLNYNFMIGDNITFNENWSALVGVNYATINTKSYNSSGTVTGEYDESKATPTLSLIYKPIEDVTTYATYMQALEDGTVVTDTNDVNFGKIFKPRVSTQYEIGSKWSVNQDLLLSTAIFRIEKANSMTENFPNGMKETTADGEEIRQGIEILATGKATENLTLMGGVTYIDSEVKKTQNKNLIGKEATGVAKYQAKMFAEYRLPVSPKIFLNGGVYYTGSQWMDGINTDKIPSYTTADLGVRYETKLDGYDTTFRIYASNITDEKYWANSGSLGDPRTVGFSATMKF
ncbi:TonB-dependent receptor [Aliarcobacter butzleri]|uniref:TonB-dependent receptor n=1 Tax=Aliarcobacter butzleri TaxID=28197 RepID=UPI002B24108C|nr:TonB-dependent siderophore receptor [Aliarcobacter butzleri]